MEDPPSSSSSAPRTDACTRLLRHPMTKKCIMSSDGPVKWFGIDQKIKSYQGVTNSLREAMYPLFVQDKRFYYGSSSSALGDKIHSQIYHVVECKESCTCPKKFKVLHEWTKKAFECLISEKISPEACEVPIVSERAMKATRVDMIATRNKGHPTNERSVLVSVKTRHRGLMYDLEDPTTMLEAPFEDVYSNPKNHDQLQLCCEASILKHEYGIVFDEFVVLYVNVELIASEEGGGGGGEAPVDRPTADLVTLGSWAMDSSKQQMLLCKLRKFRRKGGKFSSGLVKRKRSPAAGAGSEGRKRGRKTKTKTKAKAKAKIKTEPKGK